MMRLAARLGKDGNDRARTKTLIPATRTKSRRQRLMLFIMTILYCGSEFKLSLLPMRATRKVELRNLLSDLRQAEFL